MCVHMVHICMLVYWRLEINLQSSPRTINLHFVFILFYSFFVFCVRISHGLGFPEQARQIGQPQDLPFSVILGPRPTSMYHHFDCSDGFWGLNPNSQVYTRSILPTELTSQPYNVPNTYYLKKRITVCIEYEPSYLILDWIYVQPLHTHRFMGYAVHSVVKAMTVRIIGATDEG